MEHWMKRMTSTSRHSFFLTKDSPLLRAFEEEMKQSATHTSVVDTEMDLKEEIMVFSDNAGKVSVFISKTPLFDIYTFFAVLGYLAVVYVVVAAIHDVWD